jgi:hypothetical protein
MFKAPLSRLAAQERLGALYIFFTNLLGLTLKRVGLIAHMP